MTRPYQRTIRIATTGGSDMARPRQKAKPTKAIRDKSMKTRNNRCMSAKWALVAFLMERREFLRALAAVGASFASFKAWCAGHGLQREALRLAADDLGRLTW